MGGGGGGRRRRRRLSGPLPTATTVHPFAQLIDYVRCNDTSLLPDGEQPEELLLDGFGGGVIDLGHDRRQLRAVRPDELRALAPRVLHDVISEVDEKQLTCGGCLERLLSPRARRLGGGLAMRELHPVRQSLDRLRRVRQLRELTYVRRVRVGRHADATRVMLLALLLQNGKGRLAQAKSSGDSAVTAAELDNTTRIAAAGSIEADVAGESAQVDERVQQAAHG